MAAQPARRRLHTVVVGASAGGVEALCDLVSALPRDFPAAVLVVLHVAPMGTSVLPRILERAGHLAAVHAVDGAAIESGHIYVAPPDCHLLVEDGHMRVTRGPRVNGHRPAVDPLFQTAAHAWGEAAAGIVLSGALDDGTAGLLAIKRHGGATFVQDPHEALYVGMPESAIAAVDPEHVAGAHELGLELARIAAAPPPDPPAEGRDSMNDRIEEVERGASESPQPGEPSGLTCPECQGGIWESVEDGFTRFRCRVGHEYSPESFLAKQADRVETALWTALRTLEEQAATHRSLAGRLRERGSTSSARRFEARASESIGHAVVLRELLDEFRREQPAPEEDVA